MKKTSSAKSVLPPDSSVLIATFSPWEKGKRLPINGNLEPMRDYFLPRVRCVVLIDQVYPGSDFVLPLTEIYENGKLIHTHTHHRLTSWMKPLLFQKNYNKTTIRFKLRDFLSVIAESTRQKKPFDYFIGFEAINALAGIWLKRFGKIKQVIYYVSDYSPHRYGDTWFNRLYRALDRYCVMHADYVWDVSPAMLEARIQYGLDPDSSKRVFVVPNALYPEQIDVVPEKSIKKNTLVFLGTFGPENGPDLIIEALPAIKKKIPAIHVHFFGGPVTEEKKLRARAKKQGVYSNVSFHGFIADRITLSNSIKYYALALAPYRKIENSVRWYADATKMRAYFASGMPVITTPVPPLGKIAEKKGAATVVDDAVEDIADAVIEILSNTKKYREMRKSAIKFAKNNIWDVEYERVFTLMFE